MSCTQCTKTADHFFPTRTISRLERSTASFFKVGHRILGRAKLRKVEQQAAIKQTPGTELSEESGDIQEADWLLDDDENLDEEEYEVEADDVGPGPSGRLQAYTGEPAATADDIEKDLESQAFAAAMAKVAWETKAENIRVLHVAPLVYWCSYMVILNIRSRPQLQAILGKMERLAKEEHGRTISPMADTSRGSEWEVLDFMDVVVQIFTEPQRAYYDLDGYYGMAKEIDLPFLKEEQQSIPWAKNMK